MIVQVLMSTCNRKKLAELKLKGRNIVNSCVIVNQFAKEYKEEVKAQTVMYSYPEKGISKSRNRLIEHATGDIGIITDDDISFMPNYEALLEEAYLQNPDADVITFNTKKGTEVLGFPIAKKHNLYTIMTIASFQISFKTETIHKLGLTLDENFGLGARYKAGEENIFLHDCLKHHLKVIHIPIILNEHPDEATTGEKWDQALVEAKGAFSYRILKGFHWIFLLYFVALKHRNYKENLTVGQFIKSYYRGLKEYRNMR